MVEELLIADILGSVSKVELQVRHEAILDRAASDLGAKRGPRTEKFVRSGLGDMLISRAYTIDE